MCDCAEVGASILSSLQILDYYLTICDAELYEEVRSDILALELILGDLGFNCPLCSDPVSFIIAATVLSLLILFPVDWVKCEVTGNNPSRTMGWVYLQQSVVVRHLLKKVC